MKKSTLILLAVLLNLIGNSIYTQQSAKKLNVGISILEDPGLFAWQINGISNSIHAEYYLGDRKSISLSLGNIVCLKPTENAELLILSGIESANGIKIQTEYRKYLKRTKRIIPAYIFLPHLLQFNSMNNENNGYYIAGSLLHLNTQINKRQTINNNTSLYQVNRNATGIGFKIGYMCQYKFGLTLDLSFGFGLQHIISNHENRLLAASVFPANDQEVGSNKLVDTGNKIWFYPTQLFKLGWAF